MDLKSLLQLTRVEHSFMLVLAVWIGETIALGAFPNAQLALMSALPPFFVGLASFAINDYFDYASDKINRRIDRPLVRGAVTPAEARAIALACLAIGIVSSFFNQYAFVLVLLFSLLACFYSYKLKDLPLLGNIYIAMSMAVPFVYGGAVASASVGGEILMLCTIAFVAGLAREVMKSVQDVEGDKLARRSLTLPVLIGNKNSIFVSSLFYLLAIALSFLPYARGAYAQNFSYILPVLAADFLLFHIVVRTARDASKQALRAARGTSLLALGLGLAGFLAGSLLKV
ncbi:MAG: UbiA family prenyltransferase [Candidatus Micrarchaeota archaeon]